MKTRQTFKKNPGASAATLNSLTLFISIGVKRDAGLFDFPLLYFTEHRPRLIEGQKSPGQYWGQKTNQRL